MEQHETPPGMIAAKGLSKLSVRTSAALHKLQHALCKPTSTKPIPGLNGRTPRIVLLGSSVVKQWPARMYAGLGSGESDVVNLGVNGLKTVDIVQSEQNMAVLKEINTSPGVKTVVLYMGANDFLNGCTADEIGTNVLEILNALRNKRVVVVQLMQSPQLEHVVPAPTIARVHSMVEAAVDRRRHGLENPSAAVVPFLPVHFGSARDVHPSMYNFFDGLHLTTNAYERLTAEVKKVIAPP